MNQTDAAVDAGTSLADFFSLQTLGHLAWVAALTVALALAVKLAATLVSLALKRRNASRNTKAISRVIRYSGYALVGVNALTMAGLDVSALLGAAGIAGIAIGFAAQTSVSNLISGIFLLWEKPFQAGDVLSVDAISGEVETIDLLATRIRTFDNQVIRIPNETIIKSNITNITRNPIRRMNLTMTIAHEVPIAKARETLERVASDNPFCLDNPEPFFFFDKFEKDGYSILFGVWFVNEDIVALKNSISCEIQERFLAEGIRFASTRLEFDRGMPPEAAAAPGKRAK
jgi:small-conductance mechanosensitive channel